MPSPPPVAHISAGELIPGPINTHAAVVLPGVRTIHTAGQVGTFLDGSTPPTLAAQIDRALWNLDQVLAACGASRRDIVKMVYYIVGYDHTNRVHAPLLTRWLQGLRPATTLVAVPALAFPQYLFEVEAVAAVRDPTTLPALVRPPATAPPVVVDVVVVGAGLSGLAAAYEVQKAGYACVVLEARDRVGGKTWSLPVNVHGGGTAIVDAGAAWINSVNQSRMWALAQRFGLETVEQLVAGDCLSEVGGRYPYGALPVFADADDAANLASVRDQIEALCHTVDVAQPWRNASSAPLHGMTVADLVRHLGGSPTTLATVTVWTRVMNGKEPHEVGALYFLDYCKCAGGLLVMRSDTHAGGQHLRLRKGTQGFSKGLAASLQPGSVWLSTPVRSIAQGTDSSSGSPTACTVTAADGTRVLCRRVIVSVPTPLYNDIQFSPPLPKDKTALAAATSLGFLCKVILLYAAPWWRARGFNGLTQSFDGPVSIARDTSVDVDNCFSLTCFLVGDVGVRWAAQHSSTPARVAAIVDHIHALYTPHGGPPPAPVDAVVQIWNDDPWAKGGPSPVMGGGVMEAVGAALRTAVGPLHFVGTETSDVWKGYMEGAVRSGERGAAEVLEAFAAESPKTTYVAKL